MIICILGAAFILLFVFLCIIVGRGSRYKEEEAKDIPGADLYYDYGEPPYNSYKYN
jgi:hypothetical protein